MQPRIVPVFVALSLIVACLVVAGCQSSGSASHAHGQGSSSTPVSWSKSPVSGENATLLVKGLSCPLCATNIDLQLKRLPGVDTVNVDFDAGKVFVGFKGDRRPSQRQLADAIADAGFTLTGIN